MKRRILAVILLTVIALSIFPWLVYNDLQFQVYELQVQNRELQERINNQLQKMDYRVNISDVVIEKGGIPVYPLYWMIVEITIKNVGLYDVGGVTLTYKIEANQSIDYSLWWLGPEQVGVIHVGESKLIRLQIETKFFELVKFSGQKLIITLMLDNRILDEKTIVLSTLSL